MVAVVAEKVPGPDHTVLLYAPTERSTAPSQTVTPDTEVIVGVGKAFTVMVAVAEFAEEHVPLFTTAR